MMEYELDLRSKTYRYLFGGLLILAGLGMLGYLGAQVTVEARLFTWRDWQVWQGERAYRQELAGLQQAAEALAALLAGPPNPVRAQLTAAEIAALTAHGLPALSYQRQQLLAAAQAVEQWAVGADSRQAAEAALSQSFRALVVPDGR